MPSELPSGSAGRIPFISAVSGVQLAELPKEGMLVLYFR